MVNPIKGEAALGDLTLAFTFGALCALEEKTGKKMPDLMLTVQEGLGFGDIRDFVWAGLLKHHPQSEAEVLTLLDELGYEAAVTAIGAGIMAFFGEPKAKDKNPPKAK